MSLLYKWLSTGCDPSAEIAAEPGQLVSLDAAIVNRAWSEQQSVSQKAESDLDVLALLSSVLSLLGGFLSCLTSCRPRGLKNRSLNLLRK
eukprot:7718576-Alexandrium_andersonii.AAC.1